MNIDTSTIEKFLTDEEINKIEAIMANNEHDMRPDDNYGRSTITANYHYIELYSNDENHPHVPISKILLPKLKKLLHQELKIDDCHIMDSVIPYTPHTDALTPYLSEGYTHAWTIIIPLEDFNSNTFIFEEICLWTKIVSEWAKKENIQPKNTISDDFYNRYFTHSDRDHLRYLTIHEIFPWRKGWLNATYRGRFHSSDNYLEKGITSKRAIVMWTSIPIVEST
jgi:hypothetical protein